MMRLIDMREATSDEKSFAIWNTVTDCFVYDPNFGDCCFSGYDDFCECMDADMIERTKYLIPDWAK